MEPRALVESGGSPASLPHSCFGRSESVLRVHQHLNDDSSPPWLLDTVPITVIFSFSDHLQGGDISQCVTHVSILPLYSFWVTVHFLDLNNHF